MNLFLSSHSPGPCGGSISQHGDRLQALMDLFSLSWPEDIVSFPFNNLTFFDKAQKKNASELI